MRSISPRSISTGSAARSPPRTAAAAAAAGETLASASASLGASALAAGLPRRDEPLPHGIRAATAAEEAMIALIEDVAVPVRDECADDAAFKAQLRVGRAERARILGALPTEERNALVARGFVITKLSRSSHCRRCWSGLTQCFCAHVPAAPGSFKHRVWLYLTTREFMKASNTGKALHMVDPERTSIVIRDIAETEQPMLAAIAADPRSWLILYPSPESVLLDDFLDRLGGATSLTPTVAATGTTAAVGAGSSSSAARIFANDDDDDTDLGGLDLCLDIAETSTLETAAPAERPAAAPRPPRTADQVPPLNIVVLDGTWDGARRLFSRLVALLGAATPPAVRLSDFQMQSVFKLRKQSRSGRVCTLQAAVACLRELGEPDSMCDQLLSTIDHINFLKHRTYTGMTRREWGLQHNLGPFSATKETRSGAESDDSGDESVC